MQKQFASPEAAEAAFYEAFENNDANGMMAVWSTAGDVECIHPLGERVIGIDAVTDSWQRILSGRRQLRFRLSHTRRVHSDTLAVHIVYENIAIDGRRQPPVIATNVYRLDGDGWRMVLHHASPATDIETTHKSGDNTQAGETTLH